MAPGMQRTTSVMSLRLRDFLSGSNAARGDAFFLREERPAAEEVRLRLPCASASGPARWPRPRTSPRPEAPASLSLHITTAACNACGGHARELIRWCLTRWCRLRWPLSLSLIASRLGLSRRVSSAAAAAAAAGAGAGAGAAGGVAARTWCSSTPTSTRSTSRRAEPPHTRTRSSLPRSGAADRKQRLAADRARERSEAAGPPAIGRPPCGAAALLSLSVVGYRRMGAVAECVEGSRPPTPNYNHTGAAHAQWVGGVQCVQYRYTCVLLWGGLDGKK